MTAVLMVHLGDVGPTLGGVGRLNGYTGLAGGEDARELGDSRRAPRR